MEAHGGYTFCGLAALVILKRVHLLDLKSLLVSYCYCLKYLVVWFLKAFGRKKITN